LALATYLHTSYKLGCIIGLSGIQCTVFDFKKLDFEAKKETEIWLYHGEHDEVIDVRFARKTYNNMRKSGIDHYHFDVERHMEHTMTFREQFHLSAFLVD
jgi:predicted esterase